MHRAFEVIFRHPIRLLLLVVVLPAISAAVAFAMPRSYQAQATLWASQQFVTVGSNSGTGYTPAVSQMTVLNELLATRAFSIAVANEAGLHASGGTAQQRDDLLYANISGNVKVSTVGDNVVVITYTGADPQLAEKVVQATIHNYGLDSVSFAAALAQQLLQTDQQQLGQAQKAADSASKAETAYVAAHPASTQAQLSVDPQYLSLQAQVQQTQAALNSLQNSINTLTYAVGMHAGSTDTLYQVLDPPALPDKPVSRSKTLLIAGGGGLLVGLLAAVMYIVLVMRRDRSVYDPRDVQKLVPYPVLATLPAMRSSTISWALPSAAKYDDTEHA